MVGVVYAQNFSIIMPIKWIVFIHSFYVGIFRVFYFSLHSISFRSFCYDYLENELMINGPDVYVHRVCVARIVEMENNHCIIFENSSLSLYLQSMHNSLLTMCCCCCCYCHYYRYICHNCCCCCSIHKTKANMHSWTLACCLSHENEIDIFDRKYQFSQFNLCRIQLANATCPCLFFWFLCNRINVIEFKIHAINLSTEFS